MFTIRSALLVFATALVWAMPSPGQEKPRDGRLMLIAHRGVVDDERTENSLAALEEAIRRGYTHVEVDLRATRDGHAVCLHDSSLKRTTGIDKRIHEVTLEELRGLVSAEAVPSFETYCKKASGRIELMPDIKDVPPDLIESFAQNLKASLDRHGLFEEALFIGRTDIAGRFSQARIAYREYDPRKLQSLRMRAQLTVRYFVFGHAADFTSENVKGFQKLGALVIVSVNLFHYPDGDPVAQGLADIEEMLTLGVDALQIDSVYDAELVGRGASAPD